MLVTSLRTMKKFESTPPTSGSKTKTCQPDRDAHMITRESAFGEKITSRLFLNETIANMTQRTVI